jgi:competence protein ComEC
MLPPFFHQTPFFRLLLPFIAGHVVGFCFLIPSAYGILVCVFCMTGIIGMIWKWKWLYVHRLSWLYGIFLNLFFFSAGVSAVSLRSFVPAEHSEQGSWLVVVTEPPLERANSMKATVHVQAKLSGDSASVCNERVITYFRKDSLSRRIRQGDLLAMNATLNAVNNAGNPYEFDYRGYLARKHIGRSAFAESGAWQKIDSYAQNPLFNLSNRIRYSLLDVLKRSNLSGNELAVASALVLGYKADLDNELLKAYSSSGAIHVLAVSGLHVGIIFMVLKMLLLPFSFIQRTKGLRALILLSVSWLYALITGMSPSVMRAATMFSFIAVGEALSRKAYIYNSIAASAFILLLANPANLLELGFQFSYMAVIAIVFLHPFLKGLYAFKNWFPDKAWDLVCVSIAAQLGTAPLMLYYFHQFPSYFLLSNFVVIPAASVIIYGAMFLFFISPVPVLFETVGWLLDKFLYGVNFMVFFIEKLPGSITAGIRFAGWEVLFAYVLVAALAVWMTGKYKTALFATLVLVALWITGAAIRSGEDLRRQQLIVYAAQGNSLLQFVDGRDDMIWYASRNPTFNAAYLTEGYRTAMQLKPVQHYLMLDSVFNKQEKLFLPGLFNDGNYVYFANKRLVVFTRNMPPQDAGSRFILTDIAILTQNVNVHIPQIMEWYHPEIIVMDASNTQARIDRWEEECAEAGVKCHRVDRDGAFVLKNE